MSEERQYTPEKAKKNEFWKALLDEIASKTDFANFYKKFNSPKELLNHLFTANLGPTTPAEQYLQAIVLNYQQLRLSDAMQSFSTENNQERIIQLMKFAKATVGTQLAKLQEGTDQPSQIKEGDGEIANKMMQEINETLPKLKQS